MGKGNKSGERCTSSMLLLDDQIGVADLNWSAPKRKDENVRQRMLVHACRRAVKRSLDPQIIFIPEEDLAAARKEVGMPDARNKYGDIWDARHGRLPFPKRILEQLPEGHELRIDQISQDELQRMIDDKQVDLKQVPVKSGNGYYVLRISKATSIPDFAELEPVAASRRPSSESLHHQYSLSTKKMRGASGEGDVLANMDTYGAIDSILDSLPAESLPDYLALLKGEFSVARMGRQNLAHVPGIGSVEMDEFYLLDSPRGLVALGVEAKTSDKLSPSQIYQNIRASKYMYPDASAHLCIGLKPQGDDLGLALYSLDEDSDSLEMLGAVRVRTHDPAEEAEV